MKRTYTESSNEELVSAVPELNEYSLIHIFKYLPIAARVVFERVNKFWQICANRS